LQDESAHDGDEYVSEVETGLFPVHENPVPDAGRRISLRAGRAALD